MKAIDVFGLILGLLLAFMLAQLLVYGFSGVGLFAYDEAPRILIKPDISFHNLAVNVGDLLWGYCGIDVLIQAIVLFASAMGVIALLREEVKRDAH
ncbi:MAG: hypothetical protein NDF58_00610 [archaeon YNP-LCB-024-027]|nr:hypothetical protein [Candidatus Culexarchaeum yellowstonense]